METSFISYLDNIANTSQQNQNKQFGENGHIEYQWSSLQRPSFDEIKENILQIYFQLIRCSSEKERQSMKDKYTRLLQSICTPSLLNETDKDFFLNVMYKMVAYTRDIKSGKGEYSLAYMMILVWYEVVGQKYAEDLLRYFVLGFSQDSAEDEENKKTGPLGSWKDMKYFSLYCREETGDAKHPLIQYCISLLNTQLQQDMNDIIYNQSKTISLAAKWVPRENSKKFGWLFEPLASKYFIHYFVTINANENANANANATKAMNKAKMNYRKLCSSLNKQLDTVQVKQCANVWSDINYNKVTSITMTKQNKAFLNVKQNGTRRSDEEDRIVSAERFRVFVEERIKTGKEVNGKCTSMNDFVCRALDLLQQQEQQEQPNPKIQTQLDLLNSQWRDQSGETPALKNMIAMVDVSSSMEGLPLLTAIGLGCRIAEKSALGKRIMTFSIKPTWVNLEDTTNFVEMVSLVRRADWWGNTNFYAALNMILDTCVETQMHPDDVENMNLVILSDMQIDQANSMDTGTLYELMKQKYADAGKRAFGKPYKPPHIVFWNLRSTDGFPNVSTQKNTSMISGYSPALLNLFCQGRDSLQRCDPWSILMTGLRPYRKASLFL